MDTIGHRFKLYTKVWCVMARLGTFAILFKIEDISG